jgi:transposase, IS5 family
MIKASKDKQIEISEFFMHPKNLETRNREFFEQLNGFLNWNQVVYRIEKLYKKDNGRPAFPALMMLKALLLAQWYGLSDPELEDCLKDRISFKKFVGLQIDENVPDETTLCRFRNRLIEGNLLEKLFAIVNKQLEEKGFFVKKGSLIDASIICADGGKNKTKDEDASWTKKNNKSYFGYKTHASVDMDSGLINKIETTSAKVHDSKVWDELLHGEEKAIFADKGYFDNGYKKVLRKKNIFCGILDRASNNRQLSKKQLHLNKLKSKLRSPVERIFAVFKRQYGYARVRYRGLHKNRQHLFALSIAFNLQRACSLAR